MYLDSAEERILGEAEVRVDELAFAARMGNVSDESWRRWVNRPRRARSGQPQPTTTPAALEQAVLGLAVTARRLVAMPGDEVRRMKHAAAEAG